MVTTDESAMNGYQHGLMGNENKLPSKLADNELMIDAWHIGYRRGVEERSKVTSDPRSVNAGSFWYQRADRLTETIEQIHTTVLMMGAGPQEVFDALQAVSRETLSFQPELGEHYNNIL